MVLLFFGDSFLPLLLLLPELWFIRNPEKTSDTIRNPFHFPNSIVTNDFPFHFDGLETHGGHNKMIGDETSEGAVCGEFIHNRK